jgi:DNA-binding transcriptional MerR regulator
LSRNSKSLFTIGEFASRAGVTLRTLRYYDKIGLLSPCAHKESGHRLYSRQDFARLQKIMTLKFIGLSLEEIAKIIKYDVSDEDFRKSLEIQYNIMDEKISHINMIKGAIGETLHMLNSEGTHNWEKFVNIINVINMDKNWLEQYENASNLRSRIKIHELYSANKYGWMRWYFEQLDIPENSKILELGCGDGSFWYKNLDRIPSGWDITLTDFSHGMLEDAKNALKGSSHSFKFKIVDAQSIPCEDETFDVVLANHMLYHVSDKERAFRKYAVF